MDHADADSLDLLEIRINITTLNRFHVPLITLEIALVCLTMQRLEWKLRELAVVCH